MAMDNYLKNKKIYDDEFVEIVAGIRDDEIANIIKNIIASNGAPMKFSEIRNVLRGSVGDDRLRKVLIDLINKDEIVEFPDRTFGLPSMVDDYVPRNDIKRTFPLVPSKFFERWGPNPSFYRVLGLPIKDARDIIMRRSGVVKSDGKV
jgi:hypothetical protein